MSTPQLGGASPNANKISIVTKSEIRYEGILYNINPQDQNITLCNVKSFGTEGRRPGNELAPSPQIHDYIIFRGTDIKDLKVLEQGQQSAPTESTTTEQKPTQIQQQGNVQTQNVQQDESKDIKMKGDGSDFDFNAMQQNFEKFTLEHKSDVKVKSYVQDNFFDDLSTSTAEKTREIPFDRVAQKKVDKETFGSEYVDTATHRGGRGGRGRGRGSYRGGYNRNYQGGDRGGYQGGDRGGYQGGQNRGYGNQQGGYGGHQGGQGGYQQGGQNRNYGGYNKGGYNKNYGGEQQQGGRKYGGQGNYGGHQGGYNQGNRGGYGGHQGGYNQGGHQGGYNQGGQGNYSQGGNQGGQGGYNQGPKYYKTYVESNQNE